MAGTSETGKGELYQKTLEREVSIEGIGLFTGTKVSLRMVPAPVDTGIVFQRVDLLEKPRIEANLDHVIKAPRCTYLQKGNASVQTVEHILSALSAFGVDNLLIEISGPEIPIDDGSAIAFIKMIEEGKVKQLDKRKKCYRLTSTVFLDEKNVQIIGLPSEEYQISYTLHYPHSKFLGSQFYSFSLDPMGYKENIAQARTFSLYEDIYPMLKKDIIKGGGLHNALIIKDDQVLNPEGMRYSNEPVRHKILDLIGDLSLVGVDFKAHIIAICSGHMTNVAFAKTLKQSIQESH